MIVHYLRWNGAVGALSPMYEYMESFVGARMPRARFWWG